jgi:hypothetical protein
MTITELRIKIGREVTGDQSFDGSIAAYSALDADQQITLTNRMKAYIRANPKEFSEVQVTAANKPDISLTGKYTAGDAISDFSGEVGNQALEAGKSIASVGKGVLNTFNLASWLIPTVAVILVVLYLFGILQRQKAKANP